MAYNGSRERGGVIVMRQGSPNGNFGILTVDQAGAADIAADPERMSLSIQNVGTTAFAVSLTAANRADGEILHGGAALNDGNGATTTFDQYTGEIFLHDLSGGGGTARFTQITGL